MATEKLNFREKKNLRTFFSEAITGMKLKLCINVDDISLYRNCIFHCCFPCAFVVVAKEIQEFLVKIKMLFLWHLEVFISSRKINLCRLDTFPTMVANSHLCATGFRLLDYFECYPACSCSYTNV